MIEEKYVNFVNVIVCTMKQQQKHDRIEIIISFPFKS